MKQTLGGALPMHQYNDSTTIKKHLLLGAGLILCLTLSACATNRSAPADDAAAAQAQGPRVSSPTLQAAVGTSEPLRYVVKPGDTLWDIAAYFMVKPWYWPEIWHDNPQVANPHRIYPGDVLTLTHVNGRPVVKLSPGLREQPANLAIGTLPAKAVEALLDAPRLITEKQLKGASYIVAFAHGHLLGSEHATAYARLLHDDDPAQLDILRSGHPLIDPESGQRIGYLARPVGHAQLLRREAKLGTILISDSQRAIHTGDRLLPARTRIEVKDFQLRLPNHAVSGQIIDVPGDRTITGAYAVVAINRGADSGLRRGDMLQIQRPPETISDPVKGMVVVDRDELDEPQRRRTTGADIAHTEPGFAMREARVTLPAETIGALMLFVVNDHSSLGIILKSSHEIHKNDLVRAPAR